MNVHLISFNINILFSQGISSFITVGKDFTDRWISKIIQVRIHFQFLFHIPLLRDNYE